jgi:MFS transporter, Spinster family, sphingosine-1-phosphate transporter
MTDRRATYALAVLTFINLFNYIDRWVVATVVEPIKRDLGLSDTQMGFIAASFIIVYMAVSPLFGILGDRKARPPLIALGVAIWSLATGLAGFARGFWTLFAARATVGVGEAAYGTIAPALLADQFPLERRGRVMSIFFAAIPIGSAAGYILGGLADRYFGWRAAFWLVGFPGVLLAVLAMTVYDPPRGLTRNEATTIFGTIVVVTGFVGTVLGGWLGDKFLSRTKQSYLWVSGIATILAAPLAFVGLWSTSKPVYFTALVLSQVLIFMSTGPVNSAIVNAVSPLERATAVGLSVFIMHLLGDIPSPPLIGWMSDRSSLAQAVLIVPVAILVAGLIWSYAAWRGERTA